MVKIKLNCFLCGSSKVEVKYDEGKDRLHNIPGSFKILECKECGVIFTYPQLEWNEIEAYYPDNYLPYSISSSSLIGNLIDKRGFAFRKKVIKKYVSNGTLLDIGCGKGDFLKYLSEDGSWTLIGVEPNEKAAAIAAREPMITVINQTWEDLELSDNSVDCVTMWHVFEHISNPKQCLQKINRLLNENGVLIMVVPNSDSLNARIFGKYWSGYDVPRHYYTYSPRALQRLLVECGFSNLRIKSFIGGFGAMKNSISFYLADCNCPQLLKNVMSKFIDTHLFRALMTPYFYIVNSIGKGTNMIIEAKKRE